ncbi:VPLPA-CTERM sorting domain-containing protein [Pseudooceanicola onchidii]|uniref:VPLPA-CTERM sorting domain-containing protein n=1 Tax=Pseudooceanicola onchidii TaxID=2562279 RepID=UPI0010AAE3E4|nr:VPLPA-CTERM sorting domain-containing protein [Pseudooceanicola onchidii]
MNIRPYLLAVTVAVLPVAGMAASATFDVQSAANSTGGGSGFATGFILNTGDTFSWWTDVADLWRLGSDPPPREGNADGLAVSDFGNHTHVDVSAPYGTLVGSIGGSFMALGVSGTTTAWGNGELLLWNLDSNNSDNTGSIAVTISTPAVPLPAGLPLLVGGLAGLAALRRKKTSA